jgi:Myb/SANT-like DNA-binding domain
MSSNTDNNFTWTHPATVLLIESYRKCKHLLDNSAVKKAEVFRRVAAELSEHGYTATHQDCLVKMKNLTSRYTAVFNVVVNSSQFCARCDIV